MKIVSLLLIICSCTNAQKEQKSDPKIHEEEAALQYSNCNYQGDTDDIGIGLLLWDGNCNADIQLFNTPNLDVLIFSSNFCESINGICPLFYKQDYGIFHFVVLKKVETYYLISYNDGTKQAYIPINNHQKFVDWSSFLTKNATGVRKKNGSKIYQVLSVNGDFLLVKDEDNTEKEIRWNDSGKLLIEVALLI